MTNIKDSYFDLLQQSVFETRPDVLEIKLAEAFELGRKQHELNVPPDAIVMLHHEAVVNLALRHPQLNLSTVADKLTLPLIEMSMAYGLAFRQQIEQRYENMLNNRLQHSAKFEAIGTLAAGIAHDFNNILSSIVGYAELAGDQVKTQPVASHFIDQLLIASFRARDLVFRMLAFARQNPTIPTQINVVKEVAESIILLNASLPPNVKIQFTSSFDKAVILADPTQIQQIIMNLCINSADAMPDGGQVTIAIHAVKPTSDHNSMQALINTPQDICLTVSDVGEGMSDEVQAKAFDPFFTTKAPNKGSGLGLSVVYGVVASLGGKIELYSQTAGQHKGTRFSIFLPAATV